MSDYNEFLDFSASQVGYNAVDSEYPALAADLDQSATWNASLQASDGLMGGDAAAPLQLEVDPAPYEGAGSLGSPGKSLRALAPCAVCDEPYPTDSALHQHAIQAQHQAYRCKCGTGFNKASALKRHIETKDADKTFACTLCYDKFTRKDKLKDHCRHYHKVTDQGLQFLFTSQEVKPRAGAVPRRRRAAVPRVAASSGTPASPAHAPAIVGPSLSSFPASTGQQNGAIPGGPSAPTGPPATTSALQVPGNFSFPTGQFDPTADVFAFDPALNGDFSGLLGGFVGDDSLATGSYGFTF